MSCHLTFCSRFSNMGFISIFQGRKRQWHRRSNGRSTSALFRLFSHRQVSITLQKRTKVYGGSCLISLVMCFCVRHQFKMVQSKIICSGGKEEHSKLFNDFSSNQQHVLFSTTTVKGNPSFVSCVTFRCSSNSSRLFSRTWDHQKSSLELWKDITRCQMRTCFFHSIFP